MSTKPASVPLQLPPTTAATRAPVPMPALYSMPSAQQLTGLLL